MAMLVALPALLWSQAPTYGQNLASLVYLDGRNVIDNAEFPLERDQLLSLEVYDLLPNSSVELVAQQGASTLMKKVYATNIKGAVKDILFFPKARGDIRCVLRFQTIDGMEKRVVFHLKPR